VLTDASLQDRFTHLDLATLAADGGADTVQFREKRPMPTAWLMTAARDLVAALRPRGLRVIVNDRVDVAVAACTDGAHLGHDDLDAVSARRLLPAGSLLGITANSLKEARALPKERIDYLGVGPIFGTRSKPNPAPTLGLSGLAEIVNAVGIPVIAIGNITPDDVADLFAAGAYGLAVLSDVVLHADPAARVAEFRQAVEEVIGGEAPSYRTG
jgi:thiamine-phosphate pyrophosphorylase